MIYITSDLHLGHDKDFLYKPRGFHDIYSHNVCVLANFHKVVKPEDDLYILGDVFLGDNEKGMSMFHQLPGKIHLVWGNHDTDTRKALMAESWNVVEVCGYATMLKYHKYHFYLSHYPTITSNYDLDKPLKARVINLCGHTHTPSKFEDINKGLIYHCELDAHNCFPVSIDDIIADLKGEIE